MTEIVTLQLLLRATFYIEQNCTASGYSLLSNSSSPNTLLCFIYRRILLSQVMKYDFFIFSKADINRSMGTSLIQYYCHQVELPPTSPAQYRKQMGSWGWQHFQAELGQHQSHLPAVQWRVRVGCASRRPGTFGMLKHMVPNWRVHTFIRKSALRKSKHAASAAPRKPTSLVTSIIYWPPAALGRAYRKVHPRDEGEKEMISHHDPYFAK